MSTYVYLVCLDHDPPLIATEESGQHLYDLPRIYGEIANREALIAALDSDTLPDFRKTQEVNDYYTRNSAAFLARHLKCHIGIRDEYGDEHPVPTQEAT